MAQLDLSAEDKLLLYCSRMSMNKDIMPKIKEICDHVVDWNYIMECSNKQGVSPLLYWNLSKISNIKDVPYEIMKNLEKMYYNNLARNMFLYNELGKVLNAFKRVDIDTVVLKGAFLAEQVYKNAGLRTMSDIDLLIKYKDFQKAKRELNKLMYFATVPSRTELYERFQTVLSEELSFENQNKRIIVEIHWDIHPPDSYYKVDINKFWNNVKSVKIASIETLTFAPEDILQHLCLHLDKHLSLPRSPPAKPLRDYCDIAEVTRHYKDVINWDDLLQSSKSNGIEEPVFQSLSIANKYFGAIVPENILSKLKPVKSSVDFEEVFKGAMEGNLNKKYQGSEINLIMNFELKNVTCEKLLFLFLYVFPSKEFMIYRYSIKDKKQVYMYYLIRLGVAFLFGLTVLRQSPNYILRLAFRSNS